MAEPRYDFGLATRLEADALGEPGKRTFRLLVRSGSSSALVWVEKDQLLALAVAIEQVLGQVAPAEAGRADIVPSIGVVQDFPINPTVEFKLGQLQFGHDAANEQFLLIASDVEAEEEGAEPPPTLVLRATYEAANHLSKQIAALAAAGRPRCPLCGQPMGPEPHHCPLANGHIH